MPKSVSGIGLPVASEASTTRVVLRSVAKHGKTRQSTMNNWSRETLHKALNEPIVHNIQSICKLSNGTNKNKNKNLDYKG